MAQAKILVVEDEGIVSLEIQTHLKSFGYEVAGAASSGEAAIELAGQTCPDLVLMDIRLKGKLNGIIAADHIRSNFDIPVIYLTAYADEDTLKRAKVTEPFGYLLKPFEERELYGAIETALYKHRMERQLKASERWLRTVLHSIGDAIIATDRQGCIEFLNPMAETLLGWRQDEILSEPVKQVFKLKIQPDLTPIDKLFTKVLQTGTPVNLAERELISRNGQEIPIEGTLSPISNDRGRIEGVVAIFRDITERKRQEEAIRQYNVQLQAQNQELDAFAHTTAHDLQSPLSKIIGFADILYSYQGTMSVEELQESLQIISQTGQKMSNIINELLLLSGVRKITVQPQPVDMAAIVAEAQARLENLIAATHAEIILPATWPMALGYGPWLEEVWLNYLSNALKYGGQPPRLKLGAEVRADHAVRFWVQDNGPGLSVTEQAKLFTPFTQLHQLHSTGHGLGLSIVRRIVEKLSGHVGVESSGIAGQGSTFYFTLPQCD
jgi:PAS domain S-box-containing protein